MRICEKCETLNEDSYNLCKNCNHNLMNSKSYSQEEIEELIKYQHMMIDRKNKHIRIVYALLFVAYCIGLVFNLVFFNPSYLLVFMSIIFFVVGYVITFMTGNRADAEIYRQEHMHTISIMSYFTGLSFIRGKVSSYLLIILSLLMLVFAYIF